MILVHAATSSAFPDSILYLEPETAASAMLSSVRRNWPHLSWLRSIVVFLCWSYLCQRFRFRREKAMNETVSSFPLRKKAMSYRPKSNISWIKTSKTLYLGLAKLSESTSEGHALVCTLQETYQGDVFLHIFCVLCSVEFLWPKTTWMVLHWKYSWRIRTDVVKCTAPQIL